MKEGSPEKNAIRELELGRADFGCASADQVIRALEKGAKLVVLAQIFQVSLMHTQGVLLKDRLAEAGEQARFFDPAKFGVSFVANSVITSEKMLKEQPQLVEKFTAALLQGWEAAMKPAKENTVLAAVGKLERDGQKESMRKQLVVTRELVQPDASVKIGTIDKAAWQQTEAIMLGEKQIQHPVKVENCLRTQQP